MMFGAQLKTAGLTARIRTVDPGRTRAALAVSKAALMKTKEG